MQQENVQQSSYESLFCQNEVSPDELTKNVIKNEPKEAEVHQNEETREATLQMLDICKSDETQK